MPAKAIFAALHAAGTSEQARPRLFMVFECERRKRAQEGGERDRVGGNRIRGKAHDQGDVALRWGAPVSTPAGLTYRPSPCHFYKVFWAICRTFP